MKKSWIAIGIFLAACSSGGSMATMSAFHEVPLGASPPQVEEVLGKPYAIHHKEDGSIEYEYIERIKIGYRDAEERHYYILMKDGQVVSKRVKQRSPLPYGFDSYEMQTTQGTAPLGDPASP